MDLVKGPLYQPCDCKGNASLHKATIVAEWVHTLLSMLHMKCLPNDSRSVDFVSTMEFLSYMRMGNILQQTDTTNQG